MASVARILGPVALVLALAGCAVPVTLIPALPVSDGSFAVSSSARQPFYSPDDGLSAVSIRFHPEGFPGPRTTFDPERGAHVALRYAPEADPRFPERDFHAWPSEHVWLPELHGDRVYAQSFWSRYPNLSGVQVRVATFRADLSPGRGVLREGAPVTVRELPFDGRELAHVPGGADVTILGSAEGWAHIELSDGQTGFVDLDHLTEFPQPDRHNDADIEFALLDGETGEPLRSLVINAADMFDNSHVTFTFEAVPDSVDRSFRFELRAPDAIPGRSVAFRYSPTALYDEGFRFENGEVVSGDMIFRPVYADSGPLWEGWLEDFVWAAPVDAFDARFDPLPDTRGRYLEIVVSAGTAPVSVSWSSHRPPGLLPLRVDGWHDAPQGGMVFNATYRANVSIGGVVRGVARDVVSAARTDPVFMTVVGMMIVVMMVWTARAAWMGARDGR